MRYKVSPSRVGDYFVHNCDRFMVYDGLSNSDRKNIGWLEDKDFNMVAKLAGEAWEEEVLQKLAAAGEYVAMVPSDDMSLKGEEKAKLAQFRRDETIRFLKEAKPGYIYQAVLYINDIFCEKYMPNVDISQIIWNDSMSDLIKVEFDEERGCPKFSVIDMKHAKRAKINHKVQICVYIRMLESILAEQGIPGYVDDTIGYVWPFKADEPHRFYTSDIYTFVDAYFEESLPNVIDRMRTIEDSVELSQMGARLDEALDFCLSQKCEWCGNMEHCMKWAEQNAPVLLMPYMTPRTQEFFMKNPDIPRTLDAFEEYVADETNSEKLKEESGFMKNRLGYIADVINALRDRGRNVRNTAYQKPVYNMEMPKYQDIKIVLTAQRDVGLDKVYLYGLNISVKKEKNFINLPVDEKGYPLVKKVFVAKSPTEIENNTRAFVEYLYDFFSQVNDYNADAEDVNNMLSVQGYVMDNYESYNLEEGLFSELVRDDIDIEYRDKLLSIIFWLQGEKMITDSAEQAENLGSEFPVVVISSVVGKLYVIPGYISNNLEDVSKALSEKFDIGDNDYYSNSLSNALKSEPINNIWFPKKKDEKTPENKQRNLDKLAKYVIRRLSVESNIIDNIQFKDNSHTGLKRNAAKFSMVSMNQSVDKRIAKIYIQQKYEQLLTYHDMRRVRMGDLDDAAMDGKILKVEVVNEDYLGKTIKTFNKYVGRYIKEDGCSVKYKVLNSDDFFLQLPHWGITVEVGDQASRELAELDERKYEVIPDVPAEDDTSYRQQFFKLAYVNGLSASTENGDVILKGTRFGNTPYQPGTILYIVERYLDINGERVVRKLESGVNDLGLVYPECSLTDPETGAERQIYYRYPDGDDLLKVENYIDILSKYAKLDGMDFSPSQKRAFKHLFENNITLLLGPPGSGKTDFIARSILAIAGLYKELHYNLKVLVTANSHAAINNILEKLAEKKNEALRALPAGVDENALPTIIKFDKFDSDSDSDDDEVVGGISGVDLYIHNRPYLEEERRYDNNPNILVLQEFLKAVTNGKTYNPNYKIDRPFVVGATSGGTFKTNGKLYNQNGEYIYGGYDLVVIDEASQVRLGDALISMDTSNSNTRFLIVGDENQLSPIIKGRYLAPDESIDIYGSIFRAYYDIANKNGLDYLCQLEENFRMNEILDRYPGEKIYDVDIVPGDGRNGYHSYRDSVVGDSIATQTLTLDVNLSEAGGIETAVDGMNEDLMKKVLDPDYPLVLIKLSGGNASSKQQLELSLATEITKLLKEHMVDKNGNPYTTDGEFWGDSENKGAFAIISPHHEHINKLKDKISSELNMNRDKLFIGTVDKLQGQEREAVVVSYGVSNIEKALAEIEFIYSRNRLNVSITRGKKKTIVILTDVLLDKPIELLDVADENIEKGISFVCDFEKFMKKTEADTEVTYDETVTSGTDEANTVKIEIMRKRCV